MRRVIIVGAGPAGCTAALTLARRGGSGIETILLERRSLPRPKTCAGGLAPWTLALLEELGLRARVEAEAHAIHGATISNRDGATVRLRGQHRAAVLPRQRFDAILAEEARLAGASIREAEPVRALLRARGRVVGVETDAGTSLEADAVVIATGAGGRLAGAARVRRDRDGRVEKRFFGILGRYRGVSGIGDELEMFLEEELRPHYAWIFPEGESQANIGLCFQRGATGPSARTLLEGFLERRLGERMRGAVQVGRLVAQPIDATIWPQSHRLIEPGALRAGEAAGLVDAISGEGIYHALRSGLLAAEALLEGGPAPEARYARAVQRALGPRLALGGALCAMARSPLLPLVGALCALDPARRAFEALYSKLL